MTLLNWGKSVVLGLNLNGPLPACISNMLRLLGDEKTLYLGAPLMLADENAAIGREIFRRLIEKTNQLQIMKLSMAGRLIALNAILANTLWYLMFVWAPSAADIERLQDCLLNFLWDKPLDGQAARGKVKWALLSQEKIEGGLKLADPILKAQSLHAQWVMKAYAPNPPLWAGFIKPLLDSISATKMGASNMVYALAEHRHVDLDAASTLGKAVWNSWKAVRKILAFTPPQSCEQACSLPIFGLPSIWKEEWRSKVSGSSPLKTAATKGIHRIRDVWDLQARRWGQAADITARTGVRESTRRKSLNSCRQALLRRSLHNWLRQRSRWWESGLFSPGMRRG